MAFQLDKIVAAVASAFQADGNLLSLVPGGIWLRAPDEKQITANNAPALRRPYGVLRVTASQEGKECISDWSAIQDYNILIRIYGPEEIDKAGAIADFLDAFTFHNSLLQGITARIIGMFPTPPEGMDVDPEEKEGRDVLVTERAWTLKLHYSLIPRP